MSDRTDYFECHRCGGTTFFNNPYEHYSCEFIHFSEKVASFKTTGYGFIEWEQSQGWMCMECGRRHPESDLIQSVYSRWEIEDVYPLLGIDLQKPLLGQLKKGPFSRQLPMDGETRGIRRVTYPEQEPSNHIIFKWCETKESDCPDCIFHRIINGRKGFGHDSSTLESECLHPLRRLVVALNCGMVLGKSDYEQEEEFEVEIEEEPREPVVVQSSLDSF